MCEKQCESFNVHRLQGQSHRPGLFQCNDCLGTFTVTTKSVMESSHIPLTKWALAFHKMAASKKGISAKQMQRELDLGSYRTAWFLNMRIREAMGLPKMNPVVSAERARYWKATRRSLVARRKTSTRVSPSRRSTLSVP